MGSPNDRTFHLRMAALLVGALFLEHLARTRIPGWSAPEIGVVTFVLGMAWVALTAFHHGQMQRDRITVLEDRLERLAARTDAIEDDRRARRSLPGR
jgi:hypothetical protein